MTISVAFGCPFEGRVDPGVVAELAERVDAADEVVLADTIGVATPKQVAALDRARRRSRRERSAATSTTRATPATRTRRPRSRAARALLDASVGGLGGCPFAPRATGNIATEDLVYLLEGDGVETGVDLDALIEVSRWLEELLGRQLPGQVYRAGEPARAGDEPVPPPARRQPGRLVPVGGGGARRARARRTGRSCSRSATRPATGAT